MPIDAPRGTPPYRIAMPDAERPRTGDLRFGRAIRSYREAKGLSQKQLGRLLDRSQNMISDYERGKRMPPSRELRRIQEVLGLERLDEVLPGAAGSPVPNPAEDLVFNLSKRALRRMGKLTPAQRDQVRTLLEGLIQGMPIEPPKVKRPKPRR